MEGYCAAWWHIALATIPWSIHWGPYQMVASQRLSRQIHYNDVTWTSLRLKLSTNLLFVQPYVQAHIKTTSKLRVTSLFDGNPSVTDGFPSQRVINAENESFSWRHQGVGVICGKLMFNWAVLSNNDNKAHISVYQMSCPLNQKIKETIFHSLTVRLCVGQGCLLCVKLWWLQTIEKHHTVLPMTY